MFYIMVVTLVLDAFLKVTFSITRSLTKSLTRLRTHYTEVLLNSKHLLELLLPYDPVCPSVGRLVGLLVGLS